jgi:hypothetical protein
MEFGLKPEIGISERLEADRAARALCLNAVLLHFAGHIRAHVTAGDAMTFCELTGRAPRRVAAGPPEARQ